MRHSDDHHHCHHHYQVGFSVPVWMIEKMRAYIETAKTNPDTTDEELLRMAEEYAEMETDAEAVKTKKVNTILHHFQLIFLK